MLTLIRTAVNASMGAAWDKLPASTPRRPSMASIRSTVACVASAWSEHTRTSASRTTSSLPNSDAGRWWNEAETKESGSTAWIVAAIEPRGGTRARNSRPSLARALTMEITTLPASGAASGLSVDTPPSHGMATTTMSHWATSSFAAPSILRSCSGHSSRKCPAISLARSGSRDPMTDGIPATARRRASRGPAEPVPPSIPTRMGHTLAHRTAGLGPAGARGASAISPVTCRPMGPPTGKRILVTGVLTDASLAFAVARLAQEEGAEVVLSGAGRGLSLTRRTARKLRDPVDVLEIDVAQPEQLAAAAAELSAKWDRLDGLLHAIAFAPPECLGGDIFEADWEQVQVALHVSAYSLKALAEAFRPLLAAAGANGGVGASVVGLDFDATVAWPAYDWMG